MATIRQLAQDITGKMINTVRDPYWWTRQYTIRIEVGLVLKDGQPDPNDFREKVLHEVLHWVVAEDWQRVHENNLGFDKEDGLISDQAKERQERMVCHLERMLYNMSGYEIPRGNLSCGPIRLGSRLSPEEVTWMMGRCTEVGWDRLLALTRARR